MRVTGTIRGSFADTMNRRKAGWSTTAQLSAAIVVPPELVWWYYQEFGVQPRSPMTPNTAEDLVFSGTGGTRFEKSVNWPGIQGHHTVGITFTKAMASLTQDLALIFKESDYDFEKVRTAFLNPEDSYMAVIKQKIVEQMSHDLPGHKPADPRFPKQGGRLNDKTASVVFDEEATIQEK